MDLGSSYSNAFAGDFDRGRCALNDESRGDEFLESLVANADEPASDPELGIALHVK